MLHFMFVSVLLISANNVRAQCDRPVVGENQILSDESSQQTYPDGSSIKFSCSTGYVPVRSSASRTITCTGTQWGKLKLECKKKSCGHPGEINNGKYLFLQGVLFGATVTAQCNAGFLLVGQPTRNCREKGWDGRAPVCEVVKCLKPLSITDGVFAPVEDSYDYGEAVIYSCKKDLELIGPSEITCSTNGTFQPAPPQCLFVSCKNPVIPNAVRIEGKSPPYKYKNFVNYRCNTGYRMEGSGYLTCTENGWNPPPPHCTVITCSKPPSIKNGLFTPLKTVYKYGQTVTYSCDVGFRLSGIATVACTDEGTFQLSPRCLEIFCDPPVIPNAALNRNVPPYRYGVSIQIRCNKGYKIKDSDHLTCGEHGWNPTLTRCIAMTCDEPQIKYASITEGKSKYYAYHSSIWVECIAGYKMEGSKNLTCEENGWTPSPPECSLNLWSMKWLFQRILDLICANEKFRDV